ncbi:MAG: hypothetical protein H7336_06190 [Bacteriovorax sp.]|nr:hypothetical protein [Bacteriovorax sp.]
MPFLEKDFVSMPGLSLIDKKLLSLSTRIFGEVVLEVFFLAIFFLKVYHDYYH